jgi:anaerobic magnesium-protoporphyrin IX monomethyl ester cyclase
MKIVLINPNPLPESPWYTKQPVPPVGLMYVAAVLEKEGYEVKIVDAYLERLSQIELSKRIIKQDPDIVGITTDSCNFHESLRVAKLVKNVSNAVVVMGGPHVTVRAKEVVQYPEVDAVVFGEGEYTMLDIAHMVKNGKSLEGCKGCVFKENDKIIFNPPRKRIENLDVLPFPARHLLPYEKYSRTYTLGGIKTPVDTMCTSRGCLFNCSYCSSRIIWGKVYHARSPENVVAEIEHLIDNYGTKGVYFRDDNFTLDEDRILKICEILREREIDIEWECSSRVDLVNKSLLEKMYKAGCRAIWYGIESGSQETLKKLNKGIRLEQSRNAVKITKEAGIKVGGSFMIGIPGENMEDIEKTLQLIRELKCTPTAAHYFYAIPDSRLYREVVQNGWIDSVYGDILFVKTPEFAKEYLQKILKDIKSEELLWTLKNDLKNDPMKHILAAMKNPRGTFNFLRQFV